MRSSAVASGVRSTDGVVFPFQIEPAALGFDLVCMLYRASCKGCPVCFGIAGFEPEGSWQSAGGICNPRRPTPQRRSNPIRSAINTGFYAFFVKHPNRRFPRMVCQSRSALPDSSLSAESRAFRFAIHRDDLFLHNPHSSAAGSIIAPWVIIKGSCQIDKINTGESARDCRLSCVFVCW